MAKRDFFGQISQNFPTIRYIKNSPRSGAVFLSQLNQIRILPQFDFLSEEMKLINLIYYI